MEAARIRVSVIVPVYNAERWLRACLGALLDQGLGEDEYEIILVNDGSTDGSAAICESYAFEHPCVRFLSQENGGVSAARNAGLGVAAGEWVLFADADDYVNPGSLRYLLDNICSDDYDGVRFWTRLIDDGSVDNNLSCEGEIYFKGSGYDYIRQYGLETFAISFLYRRYYLDKHGLQFPSYRIGEDFYFASSFLLTNPSICATSCLVYQYLIHNGSASTSRDKAHTRQCAYDHLGVNSKLIDILERDGVREADPQVYERSIATIRSKQLLVFSRMLSSDIGTKEFRQIVKNQKKQGLLPMKWRGITWKNRLSRWTINTLAACPCLYTPVRGLYSKLFVPYILPKLDRNR